MKLSCATSSLSSRLTAESTVMVALNRAFLHRHNHHQELFCTRIEACNIHALPTEFFQRHTAFGFFLDGDDLLDCGSFLVMDCISLEKENVGLQVLVNC